MVPHHGSPAAPASSTGGTASRILLATSFRNKVRRRFRLRSDEASKGRSIAASAREGEALVAGGAVGVGQQRAVSGI